MHPIVPVLRRAFDRIVVIGLHRLDDFYRRLGVDWFAWEPSGIDTFHAIDARHVKPPPWWDDIPALWACGESHRQVICRALSDGVKYLLVMEDDCAFTDAAPAMLNAFLSELPDDWECLMLGGQVSPVDGKTVPITPRVSSCVQVERMHCYVLNRAGMQILLDGLSEARCIACDYLLGDLQEQGKLRTYRIEPFIAYQAESYSSIGAKIEANRVWDDRVNVRKRDPSTVRVVSLVCPYRVMVRLRDDGLICNGGCTPPAVAKFEPDRAERGEIELADLLSSTARNNPDQAGRVVKMLRGDAAFYSDAALALWHPSEAIELPGVVQKVIRAGSYGEAVAGLRE